MIVLEPRSPLWSNPYRIEVIITSLTEMLELPNFGYKTRSTVSFESLDKTLLMTSWTEIITESIEMSIFSKDTGLELASLVIVAKFPF